MNKLSLFPWATLLIALLFVQNLNAQTTKTVGVTGADYTTLQAAFAAINNGTITGQITLKITGSTTETASAVLKGSGTGNANYTSVLIYPTGTFSISTDGNWATINLDGADHVTIDGRIDGTGTPNNLTITNTKNEGAAAGILFVNSAESNTVKYCNVEACTPNSSFGVITFGDSNAGDGNDNNIIEYCNITSSGENRPYNGILSSGRQGRENSGCIIRNNNIYNTFQTGVSSNGININRNSVGFTISGNSIYETTNFKSTLNSAVYNAIRISTDVEHTISGNYIGGSGPLCAGAAWSFTAERAVYFCGIHAQAGTETAVTISNNTIANIAYSSKEDNPWDGIYLFKGNFEVNGNTIGATTGTGSIKLTTPLPVATATISDGKVTAITISYGGSDYSTTPPEITFSASGSTTPATATAIVSGGVVTSITINDGGAGYTSAPTVIFDGQSNSYSTSHGMIQASSGTVNITGNNIGSITTVGSDHYSHGFESIYVRNQSSTTTLTNNLIGSLTTENSIHVSSAAASSRVKQDLYGIFSTNPSTTIISGNTVANLTNAYAGDNSGTRTRGIITTRGTNTIQNNTVFNISSASAQAFGGTSASAVGIVQISTDDGTAQTMSGNTIYGIKNTNADAKSFVVGLYYKGPNSGTDTVSENFVHSLSIASTSNASDITGIQLADGTLTCANNIVSLGVGIAGDYNLSGISDEIGTAWSRNIYFNTVYLGGTVSSGGTSNTAALRSTGTSGTRNYRNNIFSNVRSGGGKHYAVTITGITGLTIGYNDYFGALSGITLNTTPDNNSKAIDPVFSSAGGTSAINYYPSESTLQGTTITDITTDYFGITRDMSTPKMGALEKNANVWQGGTSTDFSTASNWASGSVPASNADIIFATSPDNDCVLNADKSLGNITNGSSKNLVVNGHTLTVNGSLNFTSSGKIKTSTTSSSVVKFAASAAQTIPASAFENNTVAGLEIANNSGVGLNGNLTVSAGLTLAGGTLTIGANTFTITGSSIARTNGNINASNSSAALIFENTSAITLPADLFSPDINDLAISGIGGLTASSNFTVSGVLNLAAANPSSTKGLLDMGSYTLELKLDATITGIADVTGIVKRAHDFTKNLPYAFGSHFTTITFIDDGTRPSWIALKISIDTVPNWNDWIPTPDGKVARFYNIAVADNSSTASAVINMRYLVSELASAPKNDESKLIFWHKKTGYENGKPHEHGKANQNFDDHYIGVIGYVLSGVATEDLSDSEIALAYRVSTRNTWKGEASTNWNITTNWTGGNIPTENDDVLIPSGLTNYPSLSADATAQSIEIEAGVSLTANAYNITITGFQGAWINDGNFVPGTGKVTFNHGPHDPVEIVTISGTTNFYNIEAGASTTMQPVAGSILRIAGTGTAQTGSTVDFSTIDNTVEWNGADQTIVNPSGISGNSGFYNLILSGSGTKTMPSDAMNIRGKFTLAGTATATAGNNLIIDGNLLIETGATLGLGTGTHSHEIKGNITCDGTITPGTGSLITMKGSSAQSIQGEAASIALGGLTISNSSGVTLNSHATTAALTISSGAFTVAAGKSVTASGNTTLGSQQCLVLKSDETGTASFIDNGISGSGTAKVERYITPYFEVTDLKFHFLSSPVASQQIAPEFINLSSYDITDFYKWNEPTNVWISYRKGIHGTADYNLYNNDFNGNDFTVGAGYMVAYPELVTKNFVGVPSTGSITATCNHDKNGWNLIGNPYPSSVDWTKLTKGAGMDAALYYYDNAEMVYKYYSFFSGGLSGASQFIAPMQGFMVHANTKDEKTVTFSNAARTHEGQNVFYKDAPLTTNILDLKVEGKEKADYARVCFYEQATESFDGEFDAYKLFSYSSSTPELYSKTNENTSLAINTLPMEIIDGGTVPVHFKVGIPGNYTITAERINSFAASTYIFLEDKVTGAFQKLNDSPFYTFTASAQDRVDRFVLHFKDATSISEPAPQQAIAAWYNGGALTIKTQEGVTSVAIFNIQGQNLQNYQLHGRGLQTESINLPTGVYFARLINEGTMQTIKIIVQ